MDSIKCNVTDARLDLYRVEVRFLKEQLIQAHEEIHRLKCENKSYAEKQMTKLILPN